MSEWKLTLLEVQPDVEMGSICLSKEKDREKKKRRSREAVDVRPFLWVHKNKRRNTRINSTHQQQGHVEGLDLASSMRHLRFPLLEQTKQQMGRKKRKSHYLCLRTNYSTEDDSLYKLQKNTHDILHSWNSSTGSNCTCVSVADGALPTRCVGRYPVLWHGNESPPIDFCFKQGPIAPHHAS